MQAHGRLRLADLLANFPPQYPEVRSNQREGLGIIARRNGRATIEAPTGSGKTAIYYTFLKTLKGGPRFLIVPTKTLVEQIGRMHPDVKQAFGRSEYPCYYPRYQEQGIHVMADEIPCSLLVDCPHRVDQETGETHEPGAIPCPYLFQKYEAKRAARKEDATIVCTVAFYIATMLLSKEWERPAVGLVIDEAHRFAQLVRQSLTYEITDYHLQRVIDLITEIDEAATDRLTRFLRRMIRIVRSKPPEKPTLLEDREIQALIDELMRIDTEQLRVHLGEAVQAGRIDLVEEREALQKVERLVYDLSRYLRSFGYSLAREDRPALNYVYGYYEQELGERERVQYRLVINGHYVVPIARMLMAERTLACSATIGDQRIFAFETGISTPFYSLGSDFPVENARIFVPMDTPDLSYAKRGKREPNRTIRTILRACKNLGESGLRSLVLVVSEIERNKFLRFAKEEGVHAVSYGNGVPAKEIAARFKAGEGVVLIGTVSQYGEGLDLPQETVPAIFFLRPDYPVPDSPLAVFESRRFPGRYRALWQWRVMVRALQVRGRNIRSATDRGVTFFVSQSFRKIVFPALPEWLQGAYRGDLTFDQSIEETKRLFGKA